MVAFEGTPRREPNPFFRQLPVQLPAGHTITPLADTIAADRRLTIQTLFDTGVISRTTYNREMGRPPEPVDLDADLAAMRQDDAIAAADSQPQPTTLPQTEKPKVEKQPTVYPRKRYLK